MLLNTKPEQKSNRVLMTLFGTGNELSKQVNNVRYLKYK